MTDLRANTIQQFLWDQPVNDVLRFEHSKAARDHSLRGTIKAILPSLKKRSECLSLDAGTYGANVGYNMRIERLEGFASEQPVTQNLGALTYEVIANDLAAILEEVVA